MDNKLERDVRFLKIYAAVATLVVVASMVTGFTLQSGKQKFGEIDVERINIVEKNGKLDMVISNRERQHPGIVNGKVIERKAPRPPGMIFFDQSGDEMGGLIFGENGGKGHFGMFTFDKVQNDQTMAFSHLESDNGSYESGLQVWQEPNLPSDVVDAKWAAARKITDPAARNAAMQALRDNNEATQQRLYLGKLRDNSTMLVMSDIKGRPRIRMQVTADGTAKLEFLDEGGKVVYGFPNTSSK
jgi:hypothetical protein